MAGAVGRLQLCKLAQSPGSLATLARPLLGTSIGTEGHQQTRWMSPQANITKVSKCY